MKNRTELKTQNRTQFSSYPSRCGYIFCKWNRERYLLKAFFFSYKNSCCTTCSFEMSINGDVMHLSEYGSELTPKSRSPYLWAWPASVVAQDHMFSFHSRDCKKVQLACQIIYSRLPLTRSLKGNGKSARLSQCPS